MGAKYIFKCKNCGYSTQVSGRKDCGFVAVVQTMICQDCNELVDVLIGRRGKVGLTGDATYDKRLNQCPKCKGKMVNKWDEETRPCPKCGGYLWQGECVLMWD